MVFFWFIPDIQCDDDGTSLETYMWVFITARLFIGGGSSVLNTVALTYLEDNVENKIFGLFLGMFLYIVFVYI